MLQQQIDEITDPLDGPFALKQDVYYRGETDALLDHIRADLPPKTGTRWEQYGGSMVLRNDDGGYTTIMNPTTSSTEKAMIVRGRIILDPTDDDDDGRVVWGSGELLSAAAADLRYYNKEATDYRIQSAIDSIPQPDGATVSTSGGVTKLVSTSNGTVIETTLLTLDDLSAQNVVLQSLWRADDAVKKTETLTAANQYTDTKIAAIPSSSGGTAVPVNQLPLATGLLNMNNNRITGISSVVDAGDAVNKWYCDSRFLPLLPQTTLNMGGNGITNIAIVASDTAAARRDWVAANHKNIGSTDSSIQSADGKNKMVCNQGQNGIAITANGTVIGTISQSIG